jgi:iron-sulfur cluster repair protein YtfE (RIC family)
MEPSLEVACRQLLLLPAYISKWGINQTARHVARNVCASFDSELERHRNDQENLMFPALLARVGHRDAKALPDVVARLAAEHRALEQAWQRLRSSLAAIVFRRPAKLSTEEARRFVSLYRDHVAGEDQHLLSESAQR